MPVTFLIVYTPRKTISEISRDSLGKRLMESVASSLRALVLLLSHCGSLSKLQPLGPSVSSSVKWDILVSTSVGCFVN